MFRYFKLAESKKKKGQRKRWRTELKTVYSYNVCILKTGNCFVGTFFCCGFLSEKIPTTVKVLVRAILLGASTAGSMGGQWREKAAEFWQHNKPAGVREAFHLTDPLSRCAPPHCLPHVYMLTFNRIKSRTMHCNAIMKAKQDVNLALLTPHCFAYLCNLCNENKMREVRGW